jgi:glutamate carboxypeptidase
MVRATPTATAPSVGELRARAASRSVHFSETLAALVAIDSGSHDADGVDAAGTWCAERLTSLGFAVERIATPPIDGARHGGVVVGRKAGRGTARIAMFAHLDTVFPRGTAAARPYREEGGRAFGPGVCDDKGGVAAALEAAAILAETGFDGYGELVVLFTPDEEVGSPASGPIVAELLRGFDAALCLEGARENGDLVSVRKGVRDIHLDVRGRAAHAGVEPERGRSAAVEAAHLILDLHALGGTRPGVSVNVGVVSAGDGANVVPAEAHLVAEVRGETVADIDATVECILARAARPVVDGVDIAPRIFDACPPLEAAASARLLALAAEVGAGLGLDVRGAATGGVSDANFVAALGVPVLDGLGPVGGDDHAESEWLDLAGVPDRLALLAGLVVRIARP